MKNSASPTLTISNKSQFTSIWKRFSMNKLSMIGLAILTLLVVIVLAAPIYIDYSKVIDQSMKNAFQGPSTQHIFGTDQFGRDLFARVIYGGRISLFAGVITVFVAFMIGLVFGGASGFLGGNVDTIIMRFSDILMSIPAILLAMAIVAALGQGIVNMLIALSITQIPRQARYVRSAILTLRNQEFIEAAKCCGTSNFRIIVKHIIPNIIGPMMIVVMLQLGGTILSIASLGYLGIGIESPTPEWGTIISENQNNLQYYPYLGIFPGLFIIITVLCFSFIGDGLRDALDPKMKK